MDKPKVVILCGGKGTRLEGLTKEVPKPMVKVGEMPIIWHIIKHYAHYGFEDFILCTGYRGEIIKEFFDNNNMGLKISCIDTGLETNTGERILKVKDKLQNSSYFLLTYGDHVSDVDIKKVIKYHEEKRRMVTIVGSHPFSNYGVLKCGMDGGIYNYIGEFGKITDYVNAGYMVVNKEFLNLLKVGMDIRGPFDELIERKELIMYPHEGFFHSMDNVRDWETLNKLWDSGKKFWAVWENA